MGPPTLSSKLFSASHVFFFFFLASLLLAERNDQLTHTQHEVFVLQGRQNVRCYNDSCHAWEGTKEAKTNKDTLRQPQR